MKAISPFDFGHFAGQAGDDVAVAVGYQHSYINRIFKKKEGVTPSQYRDRWFGQ
ncbi:AraC family transcriptional regulator [Paenibacillus sp. PCH8]|uniref:AraC family transcriptional regulator n=1 Tax=Paenibacillus sp. PCH8 TaxID=2066524 RepID=UPI0011B053BC|nr:AraC family transcriptional regulator [Paenibacillus sp. PCH8]